MVHIGDVSQPAFPEATDCTPPSVPPLPRRPGPRRPGLGKPDYIGTTFDSTIEGLVWPTHVHARECKGTPTFHARDNMTFNGMCGKLKIVCSLGDSCTCKYWECGKWVWKSDATIEVVTPELKTRMEFVLNVKFSIAMAMGPGTKAAGYALLTGMQFRPRSDKVNNCIIKSVVLPYVMNRKKQIQEDNFTKLRGKTCVATIDNCWDHARNAEGATTSVAVDGKVICTFTDKEDLEAKLAVAASKEPVLFRLALERLIVGEGIDVAAVCIDPNAHNAKIAMQYNRMNAQASQKQNALSVHHDAYHAGAKIAKSAASALSTAKFEEFVNSMFKKDRVSLKRGWLLQSSVCAVPSHKPAVGTSQI